MRRDELEHVIRAAAAIAGEREIVVIGAAALLASVPDPPDDLAQTMEADLYPLRQPHLADVIDGAIGELSPFHETFRYHAHGVGPSTAILPAGWEDRLVTVQGQGTGGSIGHCLAPGDLAASKLAAGREKDLAFVGGMLRHGIVTTGEVLARVGTLPLDAGRRQEIAQRVEGLARDAGPAGSRGWSSPSVT